MRLGVMGVLAAALLASLAASCELAASRPQPPHPAEASAPLAPAAAPPARERPATARRTERRGDRHARAAARKAPQVKRIAGTVARADDRGVAIRAPGAAPVTLRVSPETTVTLDGRPARIDAVREGAEVRASYRTGGGRPTAIAIEAVEPAPASAPAESERSPGAEGGASWGTSDEPPPAGGG